MRFGRGAAEDDADVCIDLRERLAPYTAEAVAPDKAPDERDIASATTAPVVRGRPRRATPYQPRHLAP